MRLWQVGEHEVRLRYVPSLLFIGLGVSALTVFSGGMVLVWLGGRWRAARARRYPSSVPGP